MIRNSTLALLTLLLAPTACARRALAPSFAKVYKNVMAAQLQSRSTRPMAPYRGDEAKRIIRAYYGSLAGTDGGGAESGASANITSGQTPPSPSNNNTNPFAFKVR